MVCFMVNRGNVLVPNEWLSNGVVLLVLYYPKIILHECIRLFCFKKKIRFTDGYEFILVKLALVCLIGFFLGLLMVFVYMYWLG